MTDKQDVSAPITKADLLDFRSAMEDRFGALDARLDGMDQRFDSMNQRFDGIDKRLDAMDQRFVGIDKRFDAMDQRFDGVDKRMDGFDAMFEVMNTQFTKVFEHIELVVADVNRHTDEAVAELRRELRDRDDRRQAVDQQLHHRLSRVERHLSIRS